MHQNVIHPELNDIDHNKLHSRIVRFLTDVYGIERDYDAILDADLLLSIIEEEGFTIVKANHNTSS